MTQPTEMKTVTVFGYELVRDHIVSAIMGKNEEDILYWCGKEIARKFPLLELAEIADFFEEASWGHIELIKESKNELFYRLTGDADVLKFGQRCFRLEAGYLAEQHQKYNGFITECHEEVEVKKDQVIFQIKWDSKDPIITD